jgi:hypothetical protein
MPRMERIDADKTFATSDLYLASYLLTRGLRLWAVDRHDPGRVQFILEPRPHPDDLAAYAENTATVRVADFGRCLRTLKRRLYSDDREVGR